MRRYNAFIGRTSPHVCLNIYLLVMQFGSKFFVIIIDTVSQFHRHHFTGQVANEQKKQSRTNH